MRIRDGECLICGTTFNLQAHHAIVRKRLSNLTRWGLANGITLCYLDHIVKLHRDADKDFLDLYIEKVNARIPQDTQDDIRGKAKEPWPAPTRAELEEVCAKLTEYLLEVKC